MHRPADDGIDVVVGQPAATSNDPHSIGPTDATDEPGSLEVPGSIPDGFPGSASDGDDAELSGTDPEADPSPEDAAGADEHAAANISTTIATPAREKPDMTAARQADRPSHGTPATAAARATLPGRRRVSRSARWAS